MTRSEQNTALAFAVTASLWTLLGVVTILWGAECAAAKFLTDRIPEASVALRGATPLFMSQMGQHERTFRIFSQDTAAIDWGTILPFGGGLLLGSLMFSSGLAQAGGVHPVLPRWERALGASAGCTLSVLTPPNATVYSSGLIPITHDIRAGILNDSSAAIMIPASLLLWGTCSTAEIVIRHQDCDKQDTWKQIEGISARH